MKSIIPVFCLSNNIYQLSILSIGQFHVSISLIGDSHMLGSEVAGFDQSFIGLDGFLMQNYRKSDVIGIGVIG